MKRENWTMRSGWVIAAFLALVSLSVGPASLSGVAVADEVRSGPEIFKKFPGRWVGDGRLAFRDGKVENVKCRVTYFLDEDANGIRQNIRCASAGGKIELKSAVRHEDGRLSGSWHETIYEMKGELSGKTLPNGVSVVVKGEDGIDATMQLLVKDVRQIVEVHFKSESLLGLTLLLKRG